MEHEEQNHRWREDDERAGAEQRNVGSPLALESAQREAQMEELNEINQNKSAALELIVQEMKANPA